MKAKARNSVLPRQYCLTSQHFRTGQIIKTQSAGQSRLIVTRKTGQGLCNIRPFGEAFTPPFVIFWDGMELVKTVLRTSKGVVRKKKAEYHHRH